MLLHRTRTSSLLRLGLAGLALQGGLRLLLDRAGRATDVTDLALGALFGFSASLLLMVALRYGRKRRGGSGPDCVA